MLTKINDAMPYYDNTDHLSLDDADNPTLDWGDGFGLSNEYMTELIKLECGRGPKFQTYLLSDDKC